METLITNEIYELNRYKSISGADAVIYVTSRNFDGGAREIFESLSKDVSFYELRVDNWDSNLTPWEANPKMKGRIFKGDSKALLQRIVDEVIPVVKNQSGRIFIAGYSLAGLFSLWSLYESNVFDGCACCSGSLWYPNWTTYIKEHEISSKSKIYLSLGDREKNSKNEFMKTVYDAYLLQEELLKTKDVISLRFDLNEGGHFNDVNNRVAKGINWLIG